MRLPRPARSAGLISLVPMIDVLLILLVFFMVTSTYLNLDMIPARSPDSPGSSGAAAPPSPDTSEVVMIRLAADGRPAIRGQSLTLQDMQVLLEERIAAAPMTRVLVLPSGAASTQALVSILDVAAQTGVTQLRVLRLEARP